jgi:hypothetical protein
MMDFSKITLPEHSRIWIYQSDRALTEAEQQHILLKGKEFTSGWAAHGHELMAELTVLLDHFIILVLDEQVEAASGCSIDKSMKFILDLQRELGLSLTNRLISAFWIDEKVQLLAYAEVKKYLETGAVSGDHWVFDNTIQSLSSLKISWLKPLKETWLKKLLESQNVA